MKKMMKKYFLSVAGFIGTKVGLSPEDQEVVAYGLEVTFSLFISLILALVLGYLLGIVAETLMVALVWMVVRSLAGGAHCSTLWRCAAFSTLVMVFLGSAARLFSSFDPKLVIVIILLCGFIALTITFIWAPADNAKNRILSANRRRKFRDKALAVEIALIMFLLLACHFTGNEYSSLLLAGGMAMLVETLTVLPVGYRVMAFLDKLLERVEKAVWRGGEQL